MCLNKKNAAFTNRDQEFRGRIKKAKVSYKEKI